MDAFVSLDAIAGEKVAAWVGSGSRSGTLKSRKTGQEKHDEAVATCALRQPLIIFISTAVPFRGYDDPPDGSFAKRDHANFPDPPAFGAESYGKGITMFIPVMFSIWGIAALAAAALFVYRTSLTRDEDDQIYLDDAFQHEKDAQEAIVAKVAKIEPALRISLWGVAGMTAIIVVYFIWDLLSQLLR